MMPYRLPRSGTCTNYAVYKLSHVQLQALLILQMAWMMVAEIQFEISHENSTMIFMTCSYGDNRTGRYIDVFRNGKQCLHSAFGACSPVVSRGCRCEEEMEINEAKFTIKMPSDGYDTMRCKVIGGVSEEKVIEVNAKEEVTQTEGVSTSGPLTLGPSLTTEKTDIQTGCDAGKSDLKWKILLGLSVAGNIVLLVVLMWRLKKPEIIFRWIKKDGVPKNNAVMLEEKVNLKEEKITLEKTV